MCSIHTEHIRTGTKQAFSLKKELFLWLKRSSASVKLTKKADLYVLRTCSVLIGSWEKEAKIANICLEWEGQRERGLMSLVCTCRTCRTYQWYSPSNQPDIDEG